MAHSLCEMSVGPVPLLGIRYCQHKCLVRMGHPLGALGAWDLRASVLGKACTAAPSISPLWDCSGVP